MRLSHTPEWSSTTGSPRPATSCASTSVSVARRGGRYAAVVNSTPADGSLVEALAALRDELARTPLALEAGDVKRARRVRDELRGQIDDYLIPRLSELDAPILAVVGGSTGAGKSTLVNSLVEAEVSP